ncbi:MAG TPA: PAS domain S-box protein, partial [Anaerolineaceae bacterium]
MNQPPLAWKPSEGTELFRTLAETTSAAIFILEDLQIRYANPAAALITQYAEGELLGMDFSGLAAPSYRGVLRSRGLTGGWSADIPQRFELKLLCKDGTEKWVDLTAGSTAVEGHPAIVVTALDITGRDEAEQALRSANQLLEERVKQRTVEILIERQRLATVLQTQPAAVVISDAVGRVVERNEMADLIWGGAAPPLDTLDDYQRYQGWLAETGSELRAEDWPLVRAVRASETVIGDVIDIQRADGSRGTLLVSAAPVYDGEGNKLGGVAVAQDITAQREMERKARQEAAQLDVIFDSIDDAVVLYRADGIVERANAAARRVYGFDPTGRSQREIIREITFHSLDGRELAPDEIPSTRALTGERVSRAALIMTNPAGRESWVEVSTAPLYSAGKLTSVVVVWHDIMDREKLLAELEAGQSRLNATLQSAPEAIVTLDVQGNILLANPAALELFGQALPEPGELLEAGVVRFLRPDGTAYASGEMPILNAAVSGLPVSNLELVVELQENRRRTVQASAAPVLDSRGRPAGAVAVFQDITQLKHSEAAVRRETERLELLSSLSQAIGEAGLYYPAVLSTIAQKISESIGDGCVIRLVSDDGQWLDPVA